MILPKPCYCHDTSLNAVGLCVYPTGLKDPCFRVSNSLRNGRFGVRIPVGLRDFLFSTPVQTEPGAHISFCNIGYLVSFSVAKWPGLGFEHPPQNRAEVQNYFRPDPARKLSAELYDIYYCCVYSEKLLRMDRGTVRNM